MPTRSHARLLPTISGTRPGPRPSWLDRDWTLDWSTFRMNRGAVPADGSGDEDLETCDQVMRCGSAAVPADSPSLSPSR
jgi:hypothetical protein